MVIKNLPYHQKPPGRLCPPGGFARMQKPSHRPASAVKQRDRHGDGGGEKHQRRPRQPQHPRQRGETRDGCAEQQRAVQQRKDEPVQQLRLRGARRVRPRLFHVDGQLPGVGLAQKSRQLRRQHRELFTRAGELLRKRFDLLFNVFAAQGGVLDVLRHDLDDVRVRRHAREHALNDEQAAPEHRQRGGHGHAVFVQDLHELVHKHAHVHIGHRHGLVLVQEDADALRERLLVGRAVILAEREQRLRQGGHVLVIDRADDAHVQLRLARADAAHHAEVEPDDLPALHADVAGVGVGVEEAVDRDLADIVVHELDGDLVEIIAVGAQTVGIVDLVAGDVLHDEHVFRAPLRERGRAVGVGHAVVEPLELGDVVRLDRKVKLLLHGVPHLVEHGVKIQRARERRVLEQCGGALEQAHVAAHDVVQIRALHLHDHALAVRERRCVHLRDGGRAERPDADVRKDLLPRAGVGLRENVLHLGQRHGRHVRAQRLERGTVFFGQNVRTHGQNLPEFDKRRPEVHENIADLLRRQPLNEVMLLQNGDDLGKPLRLVDLRGSGAGHQPSSFMAISFCSSASRSSALMASTSTAGFSPSSFATACLQVRLSSSLSTRPFSTVTSPRATHSSSSLPSFSQPRSAAPTEATISLRR